MIILRAWISVIDLVSYGKDQKCTFINRQRNGQFAAGSHGCLIFGTVQIQGVFLGTWFDSVGRMITSALLRTCMLEKTKDVSAG